MKTTIDLSMYNQIATLAQANMYAAIHEYSHFIYDEDYSYEVDRFAEYEPENKLIAPKSENEIIRMMENAPNYRLGIYAGKLGFEHLYQAHVGYHEETDSETAKAYRAFADWEIDEDDLGSDYRSFISYVRQYFGE